VVGLLTDDAPEVVEGSFVDESLKAHQTDRLYRVRLRTGSAAFVYCLVLDARENRPGCARQKWATGEKFGGASRRGSARRRPVTPVGQE